MDCAIYLEKARPLFDQAFYLAALRECGESVPDEPEAHYRSIGWRFGLDPHPEFSTNGYLRANPDVRAAKIDPLGHFQNWGAAEGRVAVSVEEYSTLSQGERILRRVELIDLDFYRLQVSQQNFSSVLEALDHYLESGWIEGLDPSPSFSTRGYLHDNWDVRDDGIDPLTHYSHYGIHEGRVVVDPVLFAKPGYTTPDTKWAGELRESLALYLRHLGIDFEVESLDLRGDWHNLTNEYEWFDSDFYLDRYDDVAKALVPPLTHFVLAGHTEGRFPNPVVAGELALRTDIERVLLAKSLPMGTYNETEQEISDLRPGSTVVAEIIDRGMVASARVIVAFAHDDYVEHVGGIQVVSAREEVMFREAGDTYISIFPNEPTLALSASSSERFLVRCRVGGVLLDGTFSLVEFARAFSDQLSDRDVIVVVHSVLGHSPEAIAHAIKSFDPSTACWWVHDYSAHCQNYRLTRNGVNWCGDPAPDSQSCQLCSFGLVRSQHLNRVRSLINGVDWVFAAPSDVAADQSVLGQTPLPRRPLVLPHGGIVRDGATREACAGNEKVRLAFVGHPATIKGWSRFVAFVSDVGAEAENFEFFHFGIGDQSVPGVRFFELRPEPGGQSTATQKLVHHRIDAVMNLADGKETFNFVTYEAMAAGCCIITSPRSGNVSSAAAAEGLLIELEDDPESFDYPALREEIRAKRRIDIGEFRITGLTPSLLSEAKK